MGVSVHAFCRLLFPLGTGWSWPWARQSVVLPARVSRLDRAGGLGGVLGRSQIWHWSSCNFDSPRWPFRFSGGRLPGSVCASSVLAPSRARRVILGQLCTRPLYEGASWARFFRSHSKYPPAEPEAFRLLAPQRGLIATAQDASPRAKLGTVRSLRRVRQVALSSHWRAMPRQPEIPGTVKLLLPPRQSRGVSHRTSLLIPRELWVGRNI